MEVPAVEAVEANRKAIAANEAAFAPVNNRELRDFHEILGPELARSGLFHPIWYKTNF